jgi:hypothetical protein
MCSKAGWTSELGGWAVGRLGNKGTVWLLKVVNNLCYNVAML